MSPGADPERRPERRRGTRNVDGQDGNDRLTGNAGVDDLRDGHGVDTFVGGPEADEVDARDSGGNPTPADTIVCTGGDEIRADRNDTIVNRAECGSVERD